MVDEEMPFPKVLIYAFEYLSTMDDAVNAALVSKWWATMLGDSIIPKILEEHRLLAWYDEEGLEMTKNKHGGTGMTTYSCTAWNPECISPSRTLNAFPFPEALKARATKKMIALQTERGVTDPDAWIAKPAGSQGYPRVVTTRANRRCLQFVDGAGRNPTYLKTEIFRKPLAQPITLFCVGIAFDDATYLSGIDSRFELFHGYSTMQSPMEDDERAKVSITAHPVVDSSDSDDPGGQCVVTGTSRPGDWHVYTAVFNGKDSRLYVDGAQEGMGDSGDGMLDGLTLGTDHRNDFPLGSIIDGTHPGVIAEIAVFGSVLPPSDRLWIERDLMTRHGITLPSPYRESERAKERQAHCMLTERAPGRKRPLCPLRYLTRHPNVAWSYGHPITGKKMRPKRIGVRESAESSAWE